MKLEKTKNIAEALMWIGLVVFLFGICICLLSLAPRSIAKQIQKQNIR